MGIAEAVQSILDGFSELVDALAEWAEGVLKSMVETLESLEPDRKAPLTLGRPLMSLRYPETFKYLCHKRAHSVSYG